MTFIVFMSFMVELYKRCWIEYFVKRQKSITHEGHEVHEAKK